MEDPKLELKEEIKELKEKNETYKRFIFRLLKKLWEVNGMDEWYGANKKTLETDNPVDSSKE